MKYKVFNYLGEDRAWEHFLILGEIQIKDKRYFLVHDTIQKENFIRELFAASNKNDGLVKGNILASIADEQIWNQVLQIARKEGLIV